MTDDLPPIDPPPAPPPAAAAPARGRLWLRIVLFASLTVNILILGIFLGAVVLRGGPGRDDGAPRLRDAGLGPLAAVLTREQEHVLRQRLRDRSGELRENRARMRRDLVQLLAALRAEPFDAGAVEDILAAQRRTTTARQEIGQRAFIEALAEAGPEERRALAARIEKALRRDRRRAPSGARD